MEREFDEMRRQLEIAKGNDNNLRQLTELEQREQALLERLRALEGEQTQDSEYVT
jgi:hypothetical protein